MQMLCSPILLWVLKSASNDLFGTNAVNRDDICYNMQAKGQLGMSRRCLVAIGIEVFTSCEDSETLGQANAIPDAALW